MRLEDGVKMVTGGDLEANRKSKERKFYSISYVIGYTDTPSYLDR